MMLSVSACTGNESSKPAPVAFVKPVDITPSGQPRQVDPALCLDNGDKDPNEHPLGGLSYRSYLTFPNGVSYGSGQAYTRLVITTQVCSDQTLSSADRSTLSRILNAIGITNIQSFSAGLKLAGTGGQGMQLPALIPFSYSKNETSGTFEPSQMDNHYTPWQVLPGGWQITYNYSASSNTPIQIPSLINDVVNEIQGPNPSTLLLAPATSNVIGAVGNIVSKMVGAAFGDNNKTQDTTNLMMRTGGYRGVIYRFRDTNNHPLASMKIVAEFTTTLAKNNNESGNPPTWVSPPDIMSINIGGRLTGTLLDNISKEDSYKHILSATLTTDPVLFAGYCNDLQQKLRNTYGLNIFDEALTMYQVLYNSQYVQVQK